MSIQEFEIGDVLVHRTQGIGVITRTQQVAFVGETSECYIVEPILADPSFGQHIVSIDGVRKRGFRPILSRSEIDQAFAYVRSLQINAPGTDYSAWFWTVVTAARSNDFAKRAQATRDIRAQQREASDAMGRLLKDTERAVTWEIQVATSSDASQAHRMLDTALNPTLSS